MRKLYVPLLGIVCTSFSVIHPDARLHRPLPNISINTPLATNESGDFYRRGHFADYGLSPTAFNNAWKGYQLLVSRNVIRPDYLAICDFSQSSAKKRFYVIDMRTAAMVFNTYVAHGRNSGGEFATRFSNQPESLESSLGFYVTLSTYAGEHGLSLRLNGLDRGFNDNAFARSIVIHGAGYVDPNRARHGIFMGRSFGCPALPQNESGAIINKIKNGTCLFIYHPNPDYLQRSKILNG